MAEASASALRSPAEASHAAMPAGTAGAAASGDRGARARGDVTRAPLRGREPRPRARRRCAEGRLHAVARWACADPRAGGPGRGSRAAHGGGGAPGQPPSSPAHRGSSGSSTGLAWTSMAIPFRNGGYHCCAAINKAVLAPAGARAAVRGEAPPYGWQPWGVARGGLWRPCWSSRRPAFAHHGATLAAPVVGGVSARLSPGGIGPGVGRAATASDHAPGSRWRLGPPEPPLEDLVRGAGGGGRLSAASRRLAGRAGSRGGAPRRGQRRRGRQTKPLARPCRLTAVKAQRGRRSLCAGPNSGG